MSLDRFRPLAILALSVAATIGGSLAQDVSSSTVDDQISRGRYLVTLGGCEDCHTAGAGQFAGGRTFQSDLGVVASANLTPDPETGIGGWSADDFYRALHQGISRKAGHLYPAFPYPYFTKITRADTDALYDYLRSIPPIHNIPQRNQLSFPANIRATMAVWNALYFHGGVFKADPTQSAEWNRGAYIVQGLAHCGACHTPKNGLQADDDDRALQGGVVEGWYAPDLTSEARRGLGAWSQADIVEFLRTGRNRLTAAGGLMAGVVSGSTSKFDDADVQAIALYLRSLPPSPASRPSSLDPGAVTRGQAVFASQCSSCHGEGMVGNSGQLTPLQGSALVQADDPTTILRYLLSGMRTATTPAHPRPDEMPGFSDALDDSELASVATYIRNAWGNQASEVPASQVAKLRTTMRPAAKSQ